MKWFWLILFFAFSNIAFAQPASPQGGEAFQAHTHVRFVSEQDAIVPGQTFWVALSLTMEDSWHVYWQNPGDSGLAPKIKWNLPAGIKADNIQWPYPERIDVGPLTSYGYERKVLLLVPVKADESFKSSKEITLPAHVTWLTCQDICIPGSADLSITLPVAAQPAFNNFKKDFDATRENIPQQLNSITSRASLDGKNWYLEIQAPAKQQGKIIFYPFRDDVIEHAAPEDVHTTDQGYQLTLTKSHLYQGPLMALEGIAVNPDGFENGKTKAVIIQAPIGMVSAHVPFLLACFFALIGGLVLNLMPCVLPVLSIKVFHLLERHPDKQIALRHSLVYALGILMSVWALAALLFILKAAGKFAGWGFQFQSPIFVAVVALILLALALNLFGVFEFSTPSVSGLRASQGDYKASFLSGVITTIVASPCTAPFMGTALTVGLSQPNIVGFGIFSCLGLGLALPFIVLSYFPSLLAFIPKPGMWMIYLKKALGIVLLACVVWLVWVFGIETGIGDLSHLHSSADEIHWQPYSAAAIDQARQDRHGVFIDFTAAWCINCQVNDRLVLQNSEVVKLFKEKGIIAFKGDWTKYDPEITKALSSFGRDSIPVYIYYAPGASDPDILPQVITPNIVLKHIQ